ncbi:hypothetical protein [Chitinophaga sp. LS1]|uniref:hypothetical protein n=1 Tax=Chitinophaga sp. LS1 TaxID=3051176 RepID=UPI002AAB29F5|nr:hypothetical protein [Chitinophaga sp. LS1]WPV63919.1 hypothetical protein QQL36_19150 [Chitinophaga sp. LS1]
MEYNNWVLQENGKFVKPVFDNYQLYAHYMRNRNIAFNLDLSIVNSFIDWGKYPDSYSFWYYFVGCEEEITARLKQTELLKYESLIMNIDERDPICEIPINIFINKWLDFVAGAQYETTATTSDGKLFMEFRKGDLLYSNFKIK